LFQFHPALGQKAEKINRVFPDRKRIAQLNTPAVLNDSVQPYHLASAEHLGLLGQGPTGSLQPCHDQRKDTLS
jgi:hypothetical protein